VQEREALVEVTQASSLYIQGDLVVCEMLKDHSHTPLPTQASSSIFACCDQQACFGAVYELQGPDKNGHMQYFTKPWAMTTVMFLGMSFCLPWAYWEEYKHKKQAKEALQSANGDIRDPLLYGESLVSSLQSVAMCCCWRSIQGIAQCQ